MKKVVEAVAGQKLSDVTTAARIPVKVNNIASRLYPLDYLIDGIVIAMLTSPIFSYLMAV
jgi:hypothetical protein